MTPIRYLYFLVKSTLIAYMIDYRNCKKKKKKQATRYLLLHVKFLIYFFAISISYSTLNNWKLKDMYNVLKYKVKRNL